VLSSIAAPDGDAPVNQATSAAVAAVRENLRATETALVDRMQATAAKVAAASALYGAQDVAAATTLKI
jgi:hypothetical protein